MIPARFQDDFYAGKRGELVRFVVNDSVEITSGEYQGYCGAVISIEEVEPEIIYLVERGDTGASIYVPENHLKLI